MTSDESRWRPALLVAIPMLGFLIAFSVGEFAPGVVRLAARLGLVLLVAFFAGIPLLTRVADRDRIRRHIAEAGGRALQLQALPFWKQDWSVRLAPTRYSVRYHDLLGNLHVAKVRTSMGHELLWEEDLVVATGTPENPASAPAA